MARKKRVNPIDTNTQLANEARAVYRELRREEIDPSVAWTMVRILKVIADLMRDGDVETRLVELERKIAEGPWQASRH